MTTTISSKYKRNNDLKNIVQLLLNIHLTTDELNDTIGKEETEAALLYVTLNDLVNLTGAMFSGTNFIGRVDNIACRTVEGDRFIRDFGE